MRFFLVFLTLVIIHSASPGQIRYSNVLFIGNSITLHGPAPSIGWFGNWGMAASNKQNDYVHQFLSLLDSIQGLRPQFNIISGVGFEIGFWMVNLATYFSFADTLRPDLIVIQLGDNVNADTAAKYNFENYYYAMLCCLKSNYPQTKIITTTRFWVDKSIDTMIVNAGQQVGAMIADLATIHYDTLNFAYTQQHFDNGGVGIHPSDIGMRHIAEVMISALIAGSTDVPREQNYLPKFTLRQNYPNPFNPVTNIEFRIAKYGFVSLKIFDLLGREVTTLVNEVKAAGSYTIAFNAANLPSGVYFYRLQAENYSETEKLLLLK